MIAVDGPSGSGKSSVSRAVATQLGLRYLDTGAMYRATTLGMLREGIALTAGAIAAALPDVKITSVTDPQAPSILLDGQSVDAAIREQDVTDAVSAVSAVPEVRTAMVSLQRQYVREAVAAGTGIVVEGRDIGTTVLPDADFKFFLTASAAARAKRRALQDESEGREAGPEAAVESALQARDQADSSRKASPLTKADDALLVDATELNFEQVVDRLLQVIRDGQA